MHNTTTTGTFSKYSNSIGVSTKEMNVLLHPLEGKSLIVKTKIGSAILLECRSTEPTKCSKPVIESHVNHTVTVVTLATCKQPGRVSRSGFGSRSISEITISKTFTKRNNLPTRHHRSRPRPGHRSLFQQIRIYPEGQKRQGTSSPLSSVDPELAHCWCYCL